MGLVTTTRLLKQTKRFLQVFIDSAREWASATNMPGLQPPPSYMIVCSIDNKVFDHTEDGLIAALAWAKERAKHLKAENYCPSCRVDGPRTRPAPGVECGRPKKKLKITGAPFCVDCTFKYAVWGDRAGPAARLSYEVCGPIDSHPSRTERQ